MGFAPAPTQRTIASFETFANASQHHTSRSNCKVRAQQQQQQQIAASQLSNDSPPSRRPSLTATLARSISDIPREQWDACHDGSNPFNSHAFLQCLEESGSVAANAGWLPQHLVLTDTTTHQVQSCVPLYLKSHSYGEYVFDHSWAEAHDRAAMRGMTNRRYYPKLQSCVPFTPVTGTRLLVRPGPHESTVCAATAQTLASLPSEIGVSGLHCTFCTEEESRELAKAGFLKRIGIQYHWCNENREDGMYSTFEDFLAAMQQRKRKAVRQERKKVKAEGLRIRRLTGADVQNPALWDAFYRFYLNTIEKKWGVPYLNREFFELLSERLSDRVLLVVAEEPHGGRPVAAALNLIGSTALYGRNWGCEGNAAKGLHFELCYYQAIEEAIERGLQRVEAGAQGEHKLQRGYLPVITHSAHVLSDPGLSSAVEEFLYQERREILGYAEALHVQESPFK